MINKLRAWASNGNDEHTMFYFDLLDMSVRQIEGGYNLNEDDQPSMQFS